MREAALRNDSLRLRFRTVVAERDAVDADDGHVNQVLDASRMSRLDESPRPLDVYGFWLPGITRGMDDRVRPHNHLVHASSGGEISLNPLYVRCVIRVQLTALSADGVTGSESGANYVTPERTGAAGDEDSHNVARWWEI